MLPANGLEAAAAALLADAAATAHNAVRLAGVPRGGALCVLGAGGLGSGVLGSPGRSILISIWPPSFAARRAPSASQGLGVEVHQGLDGAARALRHSAGRMDAVIDFSGQAAAPAVGVALLRRGGRLVLGSVVDSMLTLEVSSAFMAHELQIVGAYASGIDDLAAVIELARDGRLDADSWVSHRLGLDEFDHALEIAETRPPGTVRVVVEPERG